MVSPEGSGDALDPDLDRARRLVCLEVFGGLARLSEALRRRGLSVARPVDAFPAKGVYRAADDLLRSEVFERLRAQIKRRVFRYIHFGLPCVSFSPLKRLSNGTRTSDRPLGDGSRADEIEGNLLAQRVAELCENLLEVGCDFSIENPAGSLAWKLPCMESLRSRCLDVKFDQCTLGLHLPSPLAHLRIKKPTRLLTSIPELRSLERQCDKKHTHHRCMGTLKIEGRWANVSTFAGAYPEMLCKLWSEAVWARFASVGPSSSQPPGLVRGRPPQVC